MLSRTSGMTRHIRIASTVPSPEIRFLAELLAAESPRLVLVGGWSPVYAMLLADLDIPVGVYWTSSGGQTDMSAEIAKFAAVLQDPMIHHLAFSTPELANTLRTCGKRAWYLPLTFVPPTPRPPRSHVGPLRFSLFCPPAEYRRKNITNTLFALAQVRGDYQLVINGLSQNPDYAALLKTLKIPFEELGWMERLEYEKALDTIDVGLQLSFAESFNYVAAEHLARGIPVLASPMVPVMNRLDAETRAALVVPQPDDIEHIRTQMQALIDVGQRRADLGQRVQQAVLAANMQDIALAQDTLNAMLEELE